MKPSGRHCLCQAAEGGGARWVEAARERGLRVMTYGLPNDDPEWVRRQWYLGVQVGAGRCSGAGWCWAVSRCDGGCLLGVGVPSSGTSPSACCLGTRTCLGASCSPRGGMEPMLVTRCRVLRRA